MRRPLRGPFTWSLLVPIALLIGAPSLSPAADNPGVAKSVDGILEAAREAIKTGQFEPAEKLLATARQAARADWAAMNRVTYLAAALQAYRGDYQRAATIILERLPAAQQHADDPAEFNFHNMLMMLREAQGDLPAALLECYEMRNVGERGTWDLPGRQRLTQVMLKDSWHRAYLLRLQAETLQGTDRQAVIRYAEEARRAYEKLARPLGGFDDSMAVLEALFAVHDGNKRAALRAARRVKVAANNDVEDLYLTHLALDFGGDRKAAAAVHQKMREVDYVSHAKPIMLRWIEHDLAARAGKARWSPRHPRGAR